MIIPDSMGEDELTVAGKSCWTGIITSPGGTSSPKRATGCSGDIVIGVFVGTNEMVEGMERVKN